MEKTNFAWPKTNIFWMSPETSNYRIRDFDTPDFLVRTVLAGVGLEEERGGLAAAVGKGAYELNMLEVCEPMLVEALVIWRRALPEDHPNIAARLNNLAGLYETQRRYDEAEPMYVEALAMRRRALPEGHPSIAISLWSLALIHKTKEQHEKALPMFEEAHAIWLAAHGPEHEDARDAIGMVEKIRQMIGA